MITRNIIGQKIVRVKQSPCLTNDGRRTVVDYIELENGVRLVPFAYESHAEPIGDLSAKPARKERA